jgi:hypothetical protein
VLAWHVDEHFLEQAGDGLVRRGVAAEEHVVDGFQALLWRLGLRGDADEKVDQGESVAERRPLVFGGLRGQCWDKKNADEQDTNEFHDDSPPMGEA